MKREKISRVIVYSGSRICSGRQQGDWRLGWYPQKNNCSSSRLCMCICGVYAVRGAVFQGVFSGYPALGRGSDRSYVSGGRAGG